MGRDRGRWVGSEGSGEGPRVRWGGNEGGVEGQRVLARVRGR